MINHGEHQVRAGGTLLADVPAIKEHAPERQRGRGAEARGDSADVERRAASLHEEGHAHGAAQETHDVLRERFLADERPGKEDREERPERLERGRDAARQAQRGHEQEAEEEAQVERPQNDEAEPQPPLGDDAREKKQRQGAAQRADSSDEDRLMRQKKSRRQVSRSPGDAGNGDGETWVHW
jgi:hypothetical protein